MLNEVTARKYATAWANKVHASLQDLKQSEGGGFFGLLGSLGFEYLPKESTLAVRAYIFPRDAEFKVEINHKPIWVDGLRVYPSQWFIRHNPAIWGSDAHSFKPERRLDTEYVV